MRLEILAAEPRGASAKPAPLLFVHGAWHAAWCWTEHFLPYFSGHGYRSYAVSLRGHGGSPGRDRLRWWRIVDYVEDLRRTIQELPTLPVVIAHSMGAYAGAFLKANALLGLYPIVGTPALARDILFSDQIPAEIVERTYGRIQDESYRAYLDMLGLCPIHPRRLDVPLLVLGGDRDGLFTPREFTATARAWGAEVEVLPGAGHDLMVEPSWEDGAERIAGWLRRHGF